MKGCRMAVKHLYYSSLVYLKNRTVQICIVLCTLWLIWLASGDAEEFKIVCYFGSWATYRSGKAKFDVEDIDPTLCTHLIYGLVGITENGEIDVLDKWNDLPDRFGNAGYEKFVALRKLSPQTKFMISVGGSNQGSATFSTVMADPSLRSNFVKNVVKFTRSHGFDGFDMDWEYPNQQNGGKADVENFVLLLKELRESFQANGLILSAAVAAHEISASMSYDISEISKYLHFINLLSYDFHGPWELTAGHNAPLYPARRETTRFELSFNINASVKYWTDNGAPPEKLILGTAFYGKSFTLKSATQHKPGSPIIGAGKVGDYVKEIGMLPYYEICEQVGNGLWTSGWDQEQRVPYAYVNDQWVSYDNVKSIVEKAQYIKERGLGGAMVWSIETDDFRGTCGEPNPLLKTLNLALHKNGAGRVTSNFTASLACALAVYAFFSRC